MRAEALYERGMRMGPVLTWLGLFLATACGGERRFPLREPLWRDTDLQAVSVPCTARPSDEDPQHIACAPEPYESPLAWDGADNMVFRPVTRVFALEAPDQAVNVNAFDEVPDSAWFENRIGKRHPSRAELLRGACTPEQMLSEPPAPGGWTIDRGKTNGASLGFRVRTPQGGKFMFKNDAPGQPERATAASVIGAAIYHAVGYFTSCEQIVYFDKRALHLNPGLTVTDNSGVTRAFDGAALDHVLSEANRRAEQYRMQASGWLPGYLIGPFRYERTRSDDPNDAIAHDDRRELRGGRVLAAWLNHFDAREQNTMDSWIASNPGAGHDSSPGYVRHYYIDTSDSFGSEWSWDGVSRRLGRSYILDWGDIAYDFVTLGTQTRSWERLSRRPGFELFGYYGADEFDPDGWKNEYPNPAFSRATEHDNAWMARIMSRLEPDEIPALVALGQFSQPAHAAYLANVLEARLQKILQRYFSELSPLADPQLSARGELCFTDLARRRGVWPETRFEYSADVTTETETRALPVQRGAAGRVCVQLAHRSFAPELEPGAAARYLTVTLSNLAARQPLRAHLYDLGARWGFALVGLERVD
jgi:hypothetical protein